MTITRAATVVALLTLTAGCSSVAEYAHPESGETALLHIQTSVEARHVFFYENGIDCSGRFLFFSKAAKKGFTTADAAPVVIAANKEQALEVDMSDPPRYCILTNSFFPEPGVTYRATYDGGKSACSVRLTRIDKTPDGQTEVGETFRERQTHPSLTLTSAHCRSL